MSLDLLQTSQFALYFVMVAGIIVLPGMDMAFVMASALAAGRRAGFAAVGGIVAGGVIHLLMGATGVGLILVAAPRLFNALLIGGALYVAWIGLSLLRGASALGEVRDEARRTLPSTFGRAMLTCLLNPKAYVFMLAVFPQFLRIEYGSIVAQSVVLGAITAATQAAIYGAVALGAAGLRGWLRANGAAQVALGRAVGLLLMGVAVWALVEGWQRA
jgi:threonine/homoserine/homoserine lactone efflux protein